MTSNLSIKVQKELYRFGRVMDAREDDSALIALFDRIAKSVRFSEEAKPYCFGLLFKRCAEVISDGNIIPLLHKSFFNEGAAFMRSSGISEELLEEYFSLFVFRLFSIVDKTPSAVGNLFYLVEKVGLSAKRTDTFNYLFRQGMTEDEVGLLCDLNREDMKRFSSSLTLEAALHAG